MEFIKNMALACIVPLAVGAIGYGSLMNEVANLKEQQALDTAVNTQVQLNSQAIEQSRHVDRQIGTSIQNLSHRVNGNEISNAKVVAILENLTTTVSKLTETVDNLTETVNKMQGANNE